MAKKFYVSAVIDAVGLDIGRDVEAENAYMAAIRFHEAATGFFEKKREIVVTEVEEIKNVP